MASGVIALVVGGLPVWAAFLLIAYGAGVLGLLVSRAAGAEIAVRSGVAALVLLALLAEPRLFIVVALAALAQIASTGVLIGEARRGMAGLVHEREEVARQLDRRIHELFTLQELSYILSESLQPEHILDQVARYAQRFLQAEGSLVALQEEGSGDLRILSAEGTLRDLHQRRVALGDSRLFEDAIRRSRIASVVDSGEGAELLRGVPVRAAAAIPLRAHGETMGVLAVTDRKTGAFTLQDLQLLSTVATQAAVVLANGRFFELVRQAKEEWETTFDALNEGIAVVAADGRISRANHALGRLLRVGTPSLIDQPFSETAIGATAAARELIHATRTGQRHAPVLSRLPDLSLVLRLTAATIPGGSRSSSVVLLIEDVTEQRKLESQLIHNEKMAAVGQLVSGVAHELNNPLTSITGLSEFLLEGTPPGDPDREHLKVIHHQAARAGRIVRNLLTFARKGGQEKTRLDLNELVQRTMELSLNDLRIRGITLDCEVHPGEVTAMGDAFELQQVLLNLLTNAAQA
ncbi:MAG: histidine kinase dimerization/phospho-acceptor domain-containing protein, partial [Gemmatimonadales bacterium]